MITCDECKKNFETENEFKKHCIKKRDVRHSQLIFNENNIDEWVECKIFGCGLRRSKIDAHIRNVHGLDVNEYKSKYGPVISKSFIEKTTASGFINHESDRYRGDKNPFKNHHHTTETKKQISNTLLSRKTGRKLQNVIYRSSEKFSNQKEAIIDIFERIKK